MRGGIFYKGREMTPEEYNSLIEEEGEFGFGNFPTLTPRSNKSEDVDYNQFNLSNEEFSNVNVREAATKYQQSLLFNDLFDEEKRLEKIEEENRRLEELIQEQLLLKQKVLDSEAEKIKYEENERIKKGDEKRVRDSEREKKIKKENERWWHRFRRNKNKLSIRRKPDLTNKEIVLLTDPITGEEFQTTRSTFIG